MTIDVATAMQAIQRFSGMTGAADVEAALLYCER
jgi:hypothetical protein